MTATDPAGNESRLEITVNDGHTWGDWSSNGDDTHTRTCTISGCGAPETESCTGGEATAWTGPCVRSAAGPTATWTPTVTPICAMWRPRPPPRRPRQHRVLVLRRLRQVLCRCTGLP